MRIDLHTHSTASDGQYTPTELAEMAAAIPLACWALTDHDTVAGIKEASEAAGARGLAFVPGIEISTQDVVEIHILGYGIDAGHAGLVERCREWKSDRDHRGEWIRDYLASIGVAVDLAAVREIAGGGSLGRPHFAAYLQQIGLVSSRKEAFDRYLDTPEFKRHTDRRKPTPEEAIDLIHRADGLAVLAHPGNYRLPEQQLEALVARLRSAGLDGIECCYSRHSRGQTEAYLSLMRKYELRTGCGSDFHGERVKSDIGLGLEYDGAGSELIIDHIDRKTEGEEERNE